MARTPPYRAFGLSANELYDKLNRWYFKNKLPKVKVCWSASGKRMPPALMGKTVGQIGGIPSKIVLNSFYKYRSSLWAATLLHEMVHVEQWRVVSNRHAHGPRFRKRMRELAAIGAYDNFW